MRVSDLANLTGTTVRTIRHYHHLGLVPVPESAGGRRDYGLTHVARLVRIRWLVRAGMPLASVGEVLGAKDRTPRAELVTTLAEIDDLIADLQQRRERLATILNSLDAAVGAGGTGLGLLPPAVEQYYTAVAAAAGDGPTRRAVERERTFTELAYYRGEMPPEAEALFRLLTPASLQTEVARFSHRDETLTPAELQRRAAELVDGFRRHFGDEPAPALLAAGIRLYDLYLATADPADIPLGRAVRAQLVALAEGEPPTSEENHHA